MDSSFFLLKCIVLVGEALLRPSADCSICCIVRPLKVMTFRQEDRHNYAGGPLINHSCGLLQLSLTLMLGRWCTAAVEIRQGPAWMVGFTGVCPLGGCSQTVAEEGILWGNAHQQTNSCSYHRGQPGKYSQLISLPV